MKFIDGKVIILFVFPPLHVSQIYFMATFLVKKKHIGKYGSKRQQTPKTKDNVRSSSF